MKNNIYFKQIKLFDPKKGGQLPIHIYGAGSIGSHTAIALAKVGFSNITIYDYDYIEPDNLPAQFYDLKSIDLPKPLYKIDELQRLVSEFTGTSISTQNTVIEAGFKPDISKNSIHILAFDNIESRKFLASILKGFDVHLIDARIGSFNFEKYYCFMSNIKSYIAYMQTLEGKFSELQCGEKCLWVVNSYISSRIVMDCIKITNQEKPISELQGNCKGELVLSK